MRGSSRGPAAINRPLYKQRPMNGAKGLDARRFSPVQGASLPAQRFNAARWTRQLSTIARELRDYLFNIHQLALWVG